MNFDPESYSISVRKENHDGEIYFVGRVEEFPNISSFENNPERARLLVVDAINTLKVIASETNAEFPEPYPIRSDEFSGRITLRIAKSLHAKVAKKASLEDVSVNQYLATAIATYVGETDGIAKVVSQASSLTHTCFSNAFTLFSDKRTVFKQTDQFIETGTTSLDYARSGGLKNFVMVPQFKIKEQIHV